MNQTILADEVDDFEQADLSRMHRSELEAAIVHQAKLIERFRQAITNIVRETEDEGDRVYFGSSNDADELRELDEKLQNCGHELHMPWSQGKDLIATLRRLRTENAGLVKATIREVVGEAEQACRYVAKHNVANMDAGDYRDGFEIACEVCEKAISEHVARHNDRVLAAIAARPAGEPEPAAGNP